MELSQNFDYGLEPFLQDSICFGGGPQLVQNARPAIESRAHRRFPHTVAPVISGLLTPSTLSKAKRIYESPDPPGR